jgi:hypothetical protein
LNHGDMPDSGLPPDTAAAGDVTTTGHSSHDVHAGDTHDASGAHGPADTSDQPTLVPTTWSQLIFPAIILLFVAVLVAGPVMNAFSSKPPAVPPAEQATASPSPSSAPAVVASPTLAATTIPQATATVQAAQPTATIGSASQYFLQVMATATAVAIEGTKGDVARAPVKLTFGGAIFPVADGSGLLPDWKASQDEGTATWIDGTFANHILYIPYSSKNLALFDAAKTGDNIQLQMNTGQVFNFSVTRSQRAANGPTANPEQFSVSAAMQQDHAGVTLFLAGDPALDRAVVQADFTGNIQSALP